MKTENNNNENLRSLLEKDPHIICKQNHNRTWGYCCGIVTGILLCLYPYTGQSENEKFNMLLVIVGIICVAVFCLRLLLSKKMLMEIESNASLSLGEKFYPLTSEPKLLNLLEESEDAKNHPLNEDVNGGIVVEYACSIDKQIIYLTASRWDNLMYIPTMSMQRYDGETAKNICRYLNIS